MRLERGIRILKRELADIGEDTAVSETVLSLLAELDLRPGHCVLALGADPGMTAALLAERVGPDGLVAVADSDPTSTMVLRRRMTRHYGQVAVVHADRDTGAARYAPFDRVISTVAVEVGHLPYAWVEQAEAGGTILVSTSSGVLVRFVVRHNGTAVGRPLSRKLPLATDLPRDELGAAQRVTSVRAWEIFRRPAPRWALAVALPSCRFSATPGRAWLADPVSRSWASVTAEVGGVHRVRQAGPRHLWDEAETAYAWWLEKGEPVPQDWEWLVESDRQNVRLRPKLL